MVEVILYTRPGCHLCAEARAWLEALGDRYPHRLREVDIRADRTLHARYHLAIPVVAAAGRELAAPLSFEKLAAFLAEAGRRG